MYQVTGNAGLMTKQVEPCVRHAQMRACTRWLLVVTERDLRKFNNGVLNNPCPRNVPAVAPVLRTQRPSVDDRSRRKERNSLLNQIECHAGSDKSFGCKYRHRGTLRSEDGRQWYQQRYVEHT